MPTSNSTGFARVVPFALVALALLGLASTGAFGGFAPALAFAALVFAALALALYRRHPAGVRVALLVGIVLGAALIPQFLLFVWEATHVRDNAIALAVSAAIGVLALLPASMVVTSASALRRLPPSIPSWLAALALLTGAAAGLFVLSKVGAGLAAPTALDGIEVHKLSFSADGRELTAASEYASNENVFSVPDGRFLRSEKASGMRQFRKERPAYRSDDGTLALEVASRATLSIRWPFATLAQRCSGRAVSAGATSWPAAVRAVSSAPPRSRPTEGSSRSPFSAASTCTRPARERSSPSCRGRHASATTRRSGGGTSSATGRAEADAQSAACRSVITTGRVSTSRSPHQPAASASSAPAVAPSSGTIGDGFQLNSNT